MEAGRKEGNVVTIGIGTDASGLFDEEPARRRMVLASKDSEN